MLYASSAQLPQMPQGIKNPLWYPSEIFGLAAVTWEGITKPINLLEEFKVPQIYYFNNDFNVCVMNNGKIFPRPWGTVTCIRQLWKIKQNKITVNENTSMMNIFVFRHHIFTMRLIKVGELYHHVEFNLLTSSCNTTYLSWEIKRINLLCNG